MGVIAGLEAATWRALGDPTEHANLLVVEVGARMRHGTIVQQNCADGEEGGLRERRLGERCGGRGADRTRYDEDRSATPSNLWFFPTR